MLRRIILLALLIAGPAEAQSYDVDTRVVLPPTAKAPSGKRALLVTWVTAQEQQDRGKPGQGYGLGVALVRRSTVLSPKTFPKDGLPVTVKAVPEGASVLALLGDHGAIWGMLFGGDPPTLLKAIANRRRGAVTLTLSAPTPPAERAPKPAGAKRKEPCSGERFHQVPVEFPALAGTHGNATTQVLCVVVPISYATEPRRHYPVVYVLPGLGGNAKPYLDGKDSVIGVMDRQPAAVQAIVVGVDTKVKTGSSYLVDSPTTGAWERYITEAVPGTVERQFRAIPRASARLLMGQSTGGFNSISLALRRPDVFQAAAASAADGLDFAHWLMGDDGRVRPLWLSWTQMEDALGPMGQLISYAADWSPGAGEPGYTWPFDLKTGALIPDVWKRWQAQDPNLMVQRPEVAARTRNLLGGRLFIAAATRDEFGLYPPAQRFHETLTRLGIDHVWKAYEGIHSHKVM
ncbi:MAG: S-formylglutathione hydrolase FrmB, partial [Myxococcota bacterium]